MTCAAEFIKAAGIGPDGVDAGEFTALFKEEMRRGIKKEGSSLAMIPTYMSCDGNLKDGAKAVAIDIGGTNLRTALLCFENGEVRIENFRSVPTPGKGVPILWKDFIASLAEAIKPMMQFTDRIGICISFPTTITPECDGLIHYFTKEVEMPGFEGRHVCEDLKAALGMENLTVRALNDTTAVLLSAVSKGAGGNGLMGLILGTGTNVCCQIPCGELGIDGRDGSMIVAVESGGFVSPDETETDRELDADTAAPGVYLEEKKIAGEYLGRICTIALHKAAEAGVFSAECAEKVKACTWNTQEADSFSADADEVFTAAEDAAAAAEIIDAVFDRAAKHVALTLAATLDYSAPEAADAVISADGSVFLKSNRFNKNFGEYLSKYCPGRNISYVTMKDSTLIGTAIGAAL